MKEVKKEIEEFKLISNSLENGIKMEKSIIQSVKNEIDTISIKSNETNSKAIKIKEDISNLKEDTNKLIESMSHFTF